MKNKIKLLSVIVLMSVLTSCNSRSKDPNEHLLQIGEEAVKIVKNIDDAASAKKALPKLSKLEDESKDLFKHVEKTKSKEELRKLDDMLRSNPQIKSLRESYKKERARLRDVKYYQLDSLEKACNGVFFL